MHYPHPTVEHTVEHFERVANERHDVQTRLLFDFRRAERLSADAVNYSADADLKGFGHAVAERPAAVCRIL
jgi:hypothetical protein